jgi:hypothetical protein
MIIEPSKNYEKASSGLFLATVIDIVDLGKVTNQFGTKVKIRIVWVLNANDTEGKPFRVIRQCNASINEKSALYDIAKSILGTAPPAPFDSEILIGRSNQLVIVKEADPKTGKEFANIKAILPLPAGAIPPQAPADFKRAKDMPVASYGNQASANTTGTTSTSQSTSYGQTAQPVAQPAATQANPAPAPAPAPNNVNAAF